MARPNGEDETTPRRPPIARAVSWLWLLAMVLAALLASGLAQHAPGAVVANPLALSSPGLPLGSDGLGRDYLARMLFGARVSLGLAMLSILLTVAIGTLVGFVAGAFGGFAERATMWLANVLLAVPGLLLAMLLVAAIGPGVAAVVLAVGVGGAPGYARLTRALVAQLLEEGYVVAARAAGGGMAWIGLRHILPNALPQLGSFAGTYLAWSFVGATTLTFLGLAGDPSLPEWGAMLNASRTYLTIAPRLAIAPAVCISLTILAIHTLLGETSTRVRG